MHDRDVGRVATGGDLPGDLPTGDHRGDRARAHRGALLVDDEAAVGVPVEGDADVGTVGAHALLEVDEVLGVERVGLVVGEGAVELEVHRVDRQGQLGQARAGAEDGGDGEAAHAVAGVDGDPERPGAGEVDELAQEARVVGEDVALGDRARAHPVEGGDAGVEVLLGEVADVGEAAVLPDRSGPGAAELDAVVPGRVVAGGEHRAGQTEGTTGVVQTVGAREPDEDGVHAPGGDAAGEGVDELRRARAHVVADDHGGGPLGEGDDLGEGRPERVGDVDVQLVRDDAAHVVGLDEVGERGGHAVSLVRPRRLVGRGRQSRSRRTRRWPRRPVSVTVVGSGRALVGTLAVRSESVAGSGRRRTASATATRSS